MPEVTVTVADGRRVGLTDHGDPGGSPVFLYHGTPGARLREAHLGDEAARRAIRLLMPDRPGIGDSSGPLLTSIADYASLVAATADALGIARFGVVGWSGGAPFALACGALLPDRVSGVATIAGVAPVSDPDLRCGLSSMEQGILDDLAAGRERRVRLQLRAMALLTRYARPLVLVAFKRELCEADRQDLETRSGPLLASSAAAFDQGVEGVVNEYRIWATDWGFELGSIRVPVHIWHGDDDRLVSLSHAHALAAAVPDAVLHVRPGLGHLSLVRDFGEILEGIRPAPSPRPAA